MHEQDHATDLSTAGLEEVWAEWSRRFGAAVQAAGRGDAAGLQQARQDYDRLFRTAFAPAAADTRIEAVDIDGVPAQWLTPAQADGDRTMLYLHGGAYLVGSPDGYHGFLSAYAQRLRARVLVPHYRLATEHPFPAAVDDSVTAYRWLLEQGIDPASIVISGDSAGGALTVAVMVAARQEGLPLPAAGIALSPWVNLEHTGDSMVSKHGIDPLNTRDGLVAAAALYLADAPLSAALASPVFADVHGLPPVLIQVGERELMLSDAVRLAGHLGEAAVDTTLQVAPGMPHVWHFLHDREPAAARALDDAAAFADRHLRP